MNMPAARFLSRSLSQKKRRKKMKISSEIALRSRSLLRESSRFLRERESENNHTQFTGFTSTKAER
jgi:hypothetical protein